MSEQDSLHTEKKFSLGGLRKAVSGFVNEYIFRFERKGMETKMEQPVNNYLKSPEEMEVDLSLEMNFQHTAFVEERNIMEEARKLPVQFKDGYIDIHDPALLESGFMEENY